MDNLTETERAELLELMDTDPDDGVWQWLESRRAGADCADA